MPIKWPTVQYHCPCLSNSTTPPPPHLASSSYIFHELPTLFFCEECDAVRCNRCVSVEVSGYYCPNCLFEVPSASVRAEKNRCARNCFMCPCCRNTLSVVPSDPPDATVAISAVGEPPFFLYCNHCRWDSAEVGIMFEKPTGLAAQLQKHEDSAPDSLEFERLKEHFEPVLRASSSTSAAVPSAAAHSHHIHSNSITAAASAALARDIPGVGRYHPSSSTSRAGRQSGGKDRTANKDEMPEYKSRLDIATASTLGSGGGEADVDVMKHLESVSEVAGLEQRWDSSWATSLPASDLRPLRIPLHAKRSKRCPACTHILIKPEQKAQSVRYKIKLNAGSYLPAIKATLPHLVRIAEDEGRQALMPKRAGADRSRQPPIEMNGLLPGKTYPFKIALSNPLYDQIQVRLSVPRMHAPSGRPPFVVSLPTSNFAIAPFAEAWEYEDDEEMFELDEDERFGTVREKVKTKNVGVLEKKGNTTYVGGEVAIGKEAKGEVKFNMLVSYTYRSDDPVGEAADGSPTKSRVADTKTFAFYTVVDLGTILLKDEIAEADSS